MRFEHRSLNRQIQFGGYMERAEGKNVPSEMKWENSFRLSRIVIATSPLATLVPMTASVWTSMPRGTLTFRYFESFPCPQKQSSTCAAQSPFSETSDWLSKN